MEYRFSIGKSNCKRDAGARYSALQGGCKTAKAGGTTKRPFVLQMDRGVFFYLHIGGATC